MTHKFADEIDKKDLESLKRAAKSSAGKIAESGVFVIIGTKDYHTDPLALMQFAIAIFMDKPIGFLAINNVTLSENVRKIATIEYCDDNKKSVQAATKRLLKRMEIGT